MASQFTAQNTWRGTTRTLGVLAVFVMLLALAVGVSLAAPEAPNAPLGQTSIGDCVWNDLNVNGNENFPAELGISGVVINLYKENGTTPGGYDPSEFVISQTTFISATANFQGACQNGGYYSFNTDGQAIYWVEIDPGNFVPGGPLEDYVWTNKYTTNPPDLTKNQNPGDSRIFTKVDLSNLNQGAINTVDYGFVKVDARVRINPNQATNKVGDPHNFVVKVESKVGSAAWIAETDEVPAVTINPGGAVTGNTCPSGTGSGQCVVTINSNTPAVYTANASVTAGVAVNLPGFFLNPVIISRQRDTDPATTTVKNGTDPGPGPDQNTTQTATKIYADLRIKLSQNATNKVGDPHTFTATVQQNLGAGAGWTGVSDGLTVSFTLQNNTASGYFYPSPPATSTCTTSAGSCTIVINGAKAGAVDVQASMTNINIGGVLINRTTGVSPNKPGENGGSNNATKTYVDLRISITPLNATNAIQDAHTFTATVEQNLGTGSGWALVNGATVIYSLPTAAGASFVGSNSCITGAGGTCTVVINSNTVGTTLARAETTFVVTGSGLSLTRKTGTGDAFQSANTAAFVNDGVAGNDGNGADARKDYVAGAIGNYVWWDSNGNGRQDNGEQGINDVPVRLYDATCSGTVKGSTTTGAGVFPNPIGVNGHYLFPNLPRGTYCVVIDTANGPLAATGWSETTANAVGTNDTNDSDVVAGQIKIITLDPVNDNPKEDLTNDAGYVRQADYVITKTQNSDLDGKGIRVGFPLSFSIRITNTGASWLATIPLTDTFSDEYLQFTSASINGNSTGFAQPAIGAPVGSKRTLSWSDVTKNGATYFVPNGQLAPNGVIVIVVNFVGLKDTTQLLAQSPCTRAAETCNTTGADNPTPDPDGPGGLNPQGSLPDKEAHDDIKIVNTTAIDLLDTSARFSTNGMTLRWTTVNEANILGFNVYRLSSTDVHMIGIVQAQRPGQASGASYEMVDANAEMGRSYTYMLESIQAGGATSMQNLSAVRWSYLPMTVR